MTQTFSSDISRFLFQLLYSEISDILRGNIVKKQNQTVKRRPVTIRFREAKVNRLCSTGELHWTKMDQFEIRESVPLKECSCCSGGGDLSVVVLITSTDVVRSTEYGQCSTQYTERIF